MFMLKELAHPGSSKIANFRSVVGAKFHSHETIEFVGTSHGVLKIIVFENIFILKFEEALFLTLTVFICNESKI
jgi:hypothetical protein